MREFIGRYPFMKLVDTTLAGHTEIPVFACTLLVPADGGLFICSSHVTRPDFCRAYPDPRDTNLPQGCSMRA